MNWRDDNGIETLDYTEHVTHCLRAGAASFQGRPQRYDVVSPAAAECRTVDTGGVKAASCSRIRLR